MGGEGEVKGRSSGTRDGESNKAPEDEFYVSDAAAQRRSAAAQVARSVRAWNEPTESVAEDAGHDADSGTSHSVAVSAKLKSLSRKIFRAADASVPRMPVPPMPPGCAGLADFGTRIMKWGSGDADAIARAGTVTKAEMVAAGVTAALASQWAAFYDNEKKRVPTNPSAAGRAQLMRRVAALLGS